jgi:hypothetical protein
MKSVRKLVIDFLRGRAYSSELSEISESLYKSYPEFKEERRMSLNVFEGKVSIVLSELEKEGRLVYTVKETSRFGCARYYSLKV